jgi:hypothetical protein
MTALPNINRQMIIEHKAEAERFYGKGEASIKNEVDLVRLFFNMADERGFSTGDGVSVARQFSGLFHEMRFGKIRAWLALRHADARCTCGQ